MLNQKSLEEEVLKSVTTESSTSILLAVRVTPKSRRPGISGTHAGRIKIGVSAAPDKGRANDELIEQICKLLNLSARQVTLVSGATSREKTLRIEGLSANEVTNKIILLTR